MKKKSRGIGQTLRDLAGTWFLGVAILVAGLVFTYQFVSPAPPRQIVMATGEAGGAYHQFGERFAAVLAREGIDVELRATAGSAENLELLLGDSGVDLAFVQGGVADAAAREQLVTLGTMYLEPLWLMVRTDAPIEGFQNIAGVRAAIGPEGSGTRALVKRLLTASGLDIGEATFLDLPTADLARAFADNALDAAFVIGAPESATMNELIQSPDLRLQDISRADAFTRRYSYLSKVVLPRGVLDLKRDKPEADTQTIAVGAMLVTTGDFHPALTDLLLVAAAEIHGRHSVLADAGEFPTPRFTDLPLSEAAERHYRYGPPFLMRYLPFWAATLVDRIWIMLLPLIGLSLPLVKLVPPAYRWQIRRRLLRRYAELDDIDPRQNPVRTNVDRTERLASLDRIEADPALDTMPRTYTDDVYKLRRDIDLVRRRLLAAVVDEQAAG